jgi:glycosyltransferase involved in cell wall biosynthesis
VNQIKKIKVAIIMRCKNSDWVIDQSLAALFSQDYQYFELTVVDSGSTDRTLDIVRNYPCRLIEIEAKDYYPGAVLNSIIEQTDNDLIVFQNSDAVPLSQHALGRLIRTFDDPNVHATYARQLPRPEADPWVRRDYAISFPDTETAPPWLSFSLPLAAFRRSIWEKHHFYTDAWGSEDTEWGYWAKQNGYTVKYIPEAMVMHSHNYTLRQLYGRRFIEGEADAFIFRGKERFNKVLRKITVSMVRDFIYYIKSKNWWSIAGIPIRNSVYNWAHYKGHTLGAQRLSTGNQDSSIGQKIVLERHESAKEE